MYFIKKFGNKLVFNLGSVGQLEMVTVRYHLLFLNVFNMDAPICRVRYDICRVATAVGCEKLQSFLGERLYNIA